MFVHVSHVIVHFSDNVVYCIDHASIIFDVQKDESLLSLASAVAVALSHLAVAHKRSHTSMVRCVLFARTYTIAWCLTT